MTATQVVCRRRRLTICSTRIPAASDDAFFNSSFGFVFQAGDTWDYTGGATPQLFVCRSGGTSGNDAVWDAYFPASLVGAVVYKGVWNANTNTPALASGVGTQGFYYAVSVGGTTNLDGNAVWAAGDVAIYNG